MLRKPFIRPNAFKQYIITKLLNNVVAQYWYIAQTIV